MINNPFNVTRHVNPYESIVRDPVTVAAVVFPSAIAAGGTAAFLATGATYLALTAVTSFALSILTPNNRNQSSNSSGLLANTRNSTAAREIVYGEVRKGGTITYLSATGNNNQYLHMILCLAGHEVNSIGDIYLNDEIVTIDGGNFVTSGNWDSKVRIKKHLGSSTQSADPDLISEVAELDSNFRGRGIAYLYVRFEFDSDVFANGLPSITAVVQGKKVYDPRTTITAYSDNAALCTNDYITNFLGLNNPNSTDLQVLADSADVCDEVVTLDQGGTERRYTCNGVLSTETTHRQNLEYLVSSMGGTLFWGQGSWKIKAGDYTTPVGNLTKDHIRSGISIDTRVSRRDNFNSISGTFNDKTQDYISVEYPKISPSGFLTEDGGVENKKDLSFPLVTSSSTAQRLAKQALFRLREQILVEANFSLDAFEYEVGDKVTLTISDYGWNSKEFEVVGWSPVIDTDSLELAVKLVLKETSEEAFLWDAEEEVIIANNTTLPSVSEGTDIQNLVAVDTGVVLPDGTFVGEVTLNWSTSNAYIAYYDVEWKRTADLEYTTTTTTNTSIKLKPIDSDVNYTFRVRSVTYAGFKGAYASVSLDQTGDLIAPSAPTNFNANGRIDRIELSWDNPSDTDLAFVRIYRGVSLGSQNATLIGSTAGDKYTDPLNGGLTRFYYLKSVDWSGNESVFSAVASATSGFVQESDLSTTIQAILDQSGAIPTIDTSTVDGTINGEYAIDSSDGFLYIWNGTSWDRAVEVIDLSGAVDTASLATGLAVVEIVDTLPTTGNYVGRTVLLTTDDKLYIWDGTQWNTGVAAVDIAGQVDTSQIADDAITTAQIADDAVTAAQIAAGAVTDESIANGAIGASKFATGITPVEIVSTLPNTGNFEGRTVYLTTDTKIYRHTGSPSDSTGFTVVVDGGDILANSIVAGKIATGAIGADEIASNQISVKHLAVTDYENHILNGSFFYGDNFLEGWSDLDSEFSVVSRDSGSPTNAVATAPTTEIFRVSYNASDVTADYDLSIPVIPGEKYYLEFEAAGGGSGINRTLRGSIFFRDLEGNFLSADELDALITSTVWNTYGKVVTVPANASEIYLFRFVGRSGGSANTLYATNLSLRKQNSGKLIVDGTIEAVHIAAGTITASEIATGTIEAANIAAGTITSNEIATGTIQASNIATLTITGDKIASNTITSGQIAANAITSTELASDSVIAGKIAAGAVSVDELAANSVNFKHLAVSDFENIFLNGTFANSGEGWTSFSSGFNFVNSNPAATTNAIATMPAQQALRCLGSESATSQRAIQTLPSSVPVVPGDVFKIDFDYAGVGGSINRQVRSVIRFHDSEDNFLANASTTATVTSINWATHTAKLTAPANAYSIAEVQIYVLEGGSSNDVLVTNYKIRKMNAGSLIVDGSITANMIVAGGIAANDIIADGTITATQINAGGIDATDLIATGTITGDLIQANTIAGAKLQIDNVTLDTDGSGNLIVSDNGIDFEQIVDGAATDIYTFDSGSLSGAGPHDYTIPIVVNHKPAVIITIARLIASGTGSGTFTYDMDYTNTDGTVTFSNLDGFTAGNGTGLGTNFLVGTLSATLTGNYFKTFRISGVSGFTSPSFRFKGINLVRYL